MHQIIFIITYTGEYPWYFPYFLHSCRYNPTIDFLIFTDNNDPNLELPSIVRLIPYSIERFKADAYKALEFEVAIASGYKLCDFEPAYGTIFFAFNKSLEYVNRYFNAIYLEKGKVAAWQLYSDWFEKGKLWQKSFFAYQADMTSTMLFLMNVQPEEVFNVSKLIFTYTGRNIRPV